MQQRTIVNNGKRYIVNCPSAEDVGPACEAGTLWMQSTDLNWYSVNLTGTSASNDLAFYVNQTPLTWQSVGGQDFGYQLLACIDNTASYQVYLSGSAGGVTCSIAQTPWAYDQLNCKPYLLLSSITDGYFYPVYARSGSIYLFPDPNGRVWMFNTSPPITPVSIVPLSYTPSTATIFWTDTNGTFSGDLAYFINHANVPSVTSINVSNGELTSLTLSNQLSALANLTCSHNKLTSLDVSYTTALTLLYCDNNAISSPSDIDSILVQLDANQEKGGEVTLGGGTNAVPSETGLDAKTMLEAKGWEVTVNT